jgi:hypothetical protein
MPLTLARRNAGTFVLTAVVATLACDQAAPVAPLTKEPLPAIATVGEIMAGVTVPASNAVFMAAAEPPTTGAAWQAARLQAVLVAESSNLLLMAGRAPDGGNWTALSLAQRDAAVATIEAIDAADGAALSRTSDALYETCAACHKQYLPGS